MDHEGVPWESRSEEVEGAGDAHLLDNPPIAVEVNEGAVEVEHHHDPRHILLLRRRLCSLRRPIEKGDGWGRNICVWCGCGCGGGFRAGAVLET